MAAPKTPSSGWARTPEIQSRWMRGVADRVEAPEERDLVTHPVDPVDGQVDQQEPEPGLGPEREG